EPGADGARHRLPFLQQGLTPYPALPPSPPAWSYSVEPRLARHSRPPTPAAAWRLPAARADHRSIRLDAGTRPGRLPGLDVLSAVPSVALAATQRRRRAATRCCRGLGRGVRQSLSAAAPRPALARPAAGGNR